MSNAGLCTGVDGDGMVESGAPAPVAVPPSDAATAEEPPAPDTAAATAAAAAATAAAAAAAQARSSASAPEPPSAGVEGCPKDPKASGLDVLVGAVDIVGAADIQRAESAATGDEACSQRAAPPACGNPRLGARSEEAFLSRRADSKGGNEEPTATAPRAFAGHAPGAGMGGAGAAAGTLPGFSSMNHSAAAQGTAFSTPGGTTASSSRERRVDDGYAAAAFPPPPPRGPTARDTYATMTGAALQAAAAAAAAFPGLAPKKVVHYDDEGFRLSPIPATDSGPAVKRKAAKKTKALKTKAVKTKPKTKPKPKPKPAKKTAAAKGNKSGTRRARRGPAGQSHFKGVCLTPSGTWRAVIYVDRRQKYLGVFDNEFDAARAYDAAAVLHFPDAPPPLNNPDDVERQLNAISAADGKPFATAGAPGSPAELDTPEPPRLEEGWGPRALA